MNAELSSGVRRRARVHAALGEPVRLAIVDRLTLGDVSPTEIGDELGLPSNLLAHHVTLLEHAGVVQRARSEGDGRRTYLRLRPEGLAGLSAVGARTAPRVVFVCTHNSARSQLAAALWQQHSQVPAASAGTHPAAQVHPRAVAVARTAGLTLAPNRTAHVADVLHEDDLVVAVCDNAHEELGPGERLHWSVPDPARVDTDHGHGRTPSVVFLCVHNAGRSQMALGFFRHLAGDRAVAWSGGSEPADEVNPSAVAAMAERGIDIAGESPKVWTAEIVRAADVVVTMGCGDTCPVFPGKRYLDWELDDPAGKPVEQVRPVRDEIERRVRALLAELGVPTAA